MKCAVDVFAQKKFSKDIFNSEILDLVSYKSNTNRAVISNRPGASRSSDFVILARLLPKLYSTRSNNSHESFYHINTNELPGKVSRVNMISLPAKVLLLLKITLLW